jgi:hypothetical protein
MVKRRFGALLLGSVLLTASALPACAGEENKIVKSTVQPGTMPADGKWRGVYYSQLYGHLHLVADGTAVSGKWRTAAGDKWGEMNGRVEGDLLRYTWKEHRIGMFGPNATSEGNGYFRYVVPKDENADHEIHGEWGLGDSDAGNPWDAIKQRNMDPDPDSVMPDEAESQSGAAGDWDGKKSEAATGDKSEPPPEEEKKKSEDSEDWE